MSLKNAMAAALKAIRKARGLSQYNLAEVSSRTYISKLERGQSSPTLEMVSTLSTPLDLSPLTIVALALATETEQSIRSLINHVESELGELAQAGVLAELKIPADQQSGVRQRMTQIKGRPQAKALGQAEFCFADQSHLPPHFIAISECPPRSQLSSALFNEVDGRFLWRHLHGTLTN